MKRQFNDNAFTGLEAAIVLIAFIVVAAVFSYVVLGAGFFTTQKSQEVVHTGVQQASSSLEIVGNVYGVSSNAANLTSIKFVVANTAGGTSLDVQQMVVTYMDENHHQVMAFNGTAGADINSSSQWTILDRYNAGTDNLLEPGEQFVLGVHVMNPGPNTPFTVNLQPAAGAVYSIKRTAPPAIDVINILH